MDMFKAADLVEEFADAVRKMDRHLRNKKSTSEWIQKAEARLRSEGAIEAADLAKDIAAWLRGENQDNFCNFPMRGPKTKSGWLKKVAREIRARAGHAQEGVWFTTQTTEGFSERGRST